MIGRRWHYHFPLKVIGWLDGMLVEADGRLREVMKTKCWQVLKEANSLRVFYATVRVPSVS